MNAQTRPVEAVALNSAGNSANHIDYGDCVQLDLAIAEDSKGNRTSHTAWIRCFIRPRHNNDEAFAELADRIMAKKSHWLQLLDVDLKQARVAFIERQLRDSAGRPLFDNHNQPVTGFMPTVTLNLQAHNIEFVWDRINAAREATARRYANAPVDDAPNPATARTNPTTARTVPAPGIKKRMRKAA